MEIIYLMARLWLGGLFLFFGLNGFLHFYKLPINEGPIANFNQAMVDTKYLMTTIKILEIICGVLLIANISVAFATILLAPIVFNICALHLLHNPKPWGVIISVALPQLLCMAQKWEHNIRPLFEF